MSQLALSALFEHPCYGSTVITNVNVRTYVRACVRAMRACVHVCMYCN